MPSKMKKKVAPTLGQMVKATAPRVHKPTRVHGSSKPKLIVKALRRADDN